MSSRGQVLQSSMSVLAMYKSDFIMPTGEKKESPIALIFIFTTFLISKPRTVKNYIKSS